MQYNPPPPLTLLPLLPIESLFVCTHNQPPHITTAFAYRMHSRPPPHITTAFSYQITVVYRYNQLQRIDTLLYLLVYPQV